MTPSPDPHHQRTRSKHRGNGAGSVYQRKADKLWVAALSIAGQRVTAYRHTRHDAEEALRLLRKAREENRPLRDGRQPLGDCLADWLRDVQPSISISTRQRYESVIRLHIEPAFGRTQIGKLSPAMIQALYRELQAAGKRRPLLNTIQTVLHQALRRATQWDLISRNPADYVSLPRAEPRQGPGTALTLEEAQRFLTAAEADSEWWPYWITALTTGLRPGELLALRWSKLNLETAELTVAATLEREGGLRVKELTKSRRERIVPLLPLAVDALRKHRLSQAERRLQAGPAWQNLDLVFTAAHGRIIEPKIQHRRLTRVLDAAGLPHLRPHDLRHSAASLLIALGVDPVTAALILGHSRASLTLDLYSHSSSERAREAIGRLGRALNA